MSDPSSPPVSSPTDTSSATSSSSAPPSTSSSSSSSSVPSTSPSSSTSPPLANDSSELNSSNIFAFNSSYSSFASPSDGNMNLNMNNGALGNVDTNGNYVDLSSLHMNLLPLHMGDNVDFPSTVGGPPFPFYSPPLDGHDMNMNNLMRMGMGGMMNLNMNMNTNPSSPLGGIPSTASSLLPLSLPLPLSPHGHGHGHGVGTNAPNSLPAMGNGGGIGKINICKFFANGHCSKGDKCNFAHLTPQQIASLHAGRPISTTQHTQTQHGSGIGIGNIGMAMDGRMNGGNNMMNQFQREKRHHHHHNNHHQNHMNNQGGLIPSPTSSSASSSLSPMGLPMHHHHNTNANGRGGNVNGALSPPHLHSHQNAMGMSSSTFPLSPTGVVGMPSTAPLGGGGQGHYNGKGRQNRNHHPNNNVRSDNNNFYPSNVGYVPPSTGLLPPAGLRISSPLSPLSSSPTPLISSQNPRHHGVTSGNRQQNGGNRYNNQRGNGNGNGGGRPYPPPHLLQQHQQGVGINGMTSPPPTLPPGIMDDPNTNKGFPMGLDMYNPLDPNAFMAMGDGHYPHDMSMMNFFSPNMNPNDPQQHHHMNHHQHNPHHMAQQHHLHPHGVPPNGLSPHHSLMNTMGGNPLIGNGIDSLGVLVGNDVGLTASAEDLIGRVYSLAKDQYGCRLLQRLLDENRLGVLDVIFAESFDHINDLMTDPFGNYLCQKLIEHCVDAQRLAILHKVSTDLVAISLNLHGTRAVQKLVETISTPAEIEILIHSLRSSVVTLIKDLNGNHVIQRALHHLSSKDNQFIYDSVCRQCVSVATHKHGCCVLQRCVDYATIQQKKQIVSEIIATSLELVQDAYGNYVVQYVLDLGEPNTSNQIIANLLGHISSLAVQKFSSNVIEKCLELANDKMRGKVVDEIVNGDKLSRLLQDPFANYVIQKALSVSKKSQLDRLVVVIKPHLHALRHTSFGKRIQNKILKKFPDMELPGGGEMGGEMEGEEDEENERNHNQNNKREEEEEEGRDGRDSREYQEETNDKRRGEEMTSSSSSSSSSSSYGHHSTGISDGNSLEGSSHSSDANGNLFGGETSMASASAQ